MKKFKSSLSHAIDGVHKTYRDEPNMRIHVLIALVALIFGYLLCLNSIEWILLFIVICLVIVTEVINTIFERLLDMVKPTVNDYIRDMKDMMAAAVFFTSLLALIVGIVIFIPKLAQVLGSLLLSLS